ncbi:MAG: hypothetical protein ACJAQ0_000381, partial [Dasania sp.]
NKGAYTDHDDNTSGSGGHDDIDINYVEQLVEIAEDSAENAEESEQNANQPN